MRTIYSIILALGLLTAAPAFGAECKFTVADAVREAEDRGLSYQIVTDAKLVQAVVEAAKLKGFKIPDGSVRVVAAMVGNQLYYGFEIKGCMFGPITLRGSSV